ncbi:YebC/PmpR family DNA-binding transcriptional regulator [Campylobacter hyointestinalis subsp. hyointestinalis]|uniref:Probable transcriptional regulatory protein ERS739223_01516 n=1 Tax=Campylobacter hyointestinalis subsp. hyointestinalis TaxID=91352 RepID=A0A9W5AVD7_CAMHY|nr:YebC/PmpR family DNA-binding transcriptional regulator [Campylobacter hyointestinalis]QCT99522.1 YebC/PmpR family DNA-binding transcriptional regulator [Campylobacter hyointestinalis subsp. hyointestinalis]TWO22764.1 YebC/PmpR family DNA-binding transcriptional regulator [Campylobacter hyointestinalis]CUU84232.1 transcriptional regulator [Campylobacter hyointestinalis subsp. hyointestinalis]CUU85126.1 transcriptional regulator [Campylobacter hyointestinalis subsp. hyointestinalis]CUU90059.1
MGRAFEYRRASKEARWDKMSKLFPKLGKAITVAAKEGGMDPEMNPKLRTAIATAKAQNMPKDNIDAAIKRANGKDSSDIKTIFYDGKAAHGVQIVVEAATDNPTRTVANVKAIFSKNGGEMLPSGSLNFMFSRKAVFEVVKPSGDIEELELELIDAGLTDIEENDETITIYGDYTSFGTLSEGIDKMGLEVKKGSLQFIPNSTVNLDESALGELERLLDKLEDDDDVQAVYTNIE